MSTKNALDKLRVGLSTSYKSSFFNQGQEVIESDIKGIVSKNEEIFFNEFKKSSISLFYQCKALYEINIALKKDGLFMEWCKHVKLTKDKASEMLKRYELYSHFPENKIWVSSLSVSAVKLLTHKALELEQLYDIAEQELKGIDEIKEFLLATLVTDPLSHEAVADSTPDEIINEFKDIKSRIKEIKGSKNIIAYKSQIKSLKRDMEEIEFLILEQEKKEVDKNQTNLFES